MFCAKGVGSVGSFGPCQLPYPSYCRSTVSHSELAQDRRDVVIDGLRGNEQPGRDLGKKSNNTAPRPRAGQCPPQCLPQDCVRGRACGSLAAPVGVPGDQRAST